MVNIPERARDFARIKHTGQKRDDGKDYFEAHLCQVVDILKLITNDNDVICAGYLHDTLEDTDTNYEELVEIFGKRIADLVVECTHEGKKDEVGFYFPKLKTKEGIIIKFADRLSNLSQMDCWNEKRQQQYLRKSKFWKSSSKTKNYTKSEDKK